MDASSMRSTGFVRKVCIEKVLYDLFIDKP